MKTSVSLSKIIVPCGRTIEFLPISDIIKLEGLQNYTRIYLTGERVLVSTNNLGYYITQLEHQGFYLCHKSYVVHIDKIKRYHKNGYIEMVDDSKIPVARRRRAEFISEVLSSTELPSA